MTAQDRIETLKTGRGYYRTYRNLQRRRGNLGQAEAADREIERIQFELRQLQREAAQSDKQQEAIA